MTTALLLCDSAVIRHVSSVWEFINGAALRLILIKAVSGPMSSLGHFIQNTQLVRISGSPPPCWSEGPENAVKNDLFHGGRDEPRSKSAPL